MNFRFAFRIRPDRLDGNGKAAVFAEVSWKLGRRGAGVERISITTGVTVAPENWMETRRKQAEEAGKRLPTGERFIYRAERGSLASNLRLERIQAAVTEVFTKAELNATIPTPDDVRAAVASVVPAGGVARQPTTTKAKAGFVPAPDSSMFDLLAYWKELNKGILATKTLSKYNAIPERMNEFTPGITVRQITREWVMRYVAHCYESGLHDASVADSYKWLREAFRLSGQPVPRYLLHLKVRTGTKPVLLPREFKALMALDLKREPELEAERDVFVFQTLMLLRDVDMKALAPHRARPIVFDAGEVLGLVLTQQKTDIDVLGVMPPAAEAIWRRYKGQLPVVTNQERNRRIKLVATRAKLTREVAMTKFAGPKRTETVQPLRRIIATHMARHSGATFILQGSKGDRDLKEIALGHSNDVYAPSDVYLYGPKILAAWHAVLERPERELPQVADVGDDDE